MPNKMQNISNCIDYEIRQFKWLDIQKYLDQIIDMQLENIYKFHYPERTPNRDYVKGKILDLEKHLENNNTYFIGAIKEDVVYGYIWCYESLFIDEKRMSINSLFVCEKVRGTGLGKMLMNEAKKVAIHNGCGSIGTHYASFNTDTGKFYFNNGFRETRIEMVYKIE